MPSKVPEKGNIQYQSTINGAFVSGSSMAMRMTLK